MQRAAINEVRENEKQEAQILLLLIEIMEYKWNKKNSY